MNEKEVKLKKGWVLIQKYEYLLDNFKKLEAENAELRKKLEIMPAWEHDVRTVRLKQELYRYDERLAKVTINNRELKSRWEKLKAWAKMTRINDNYDIILKMQELEKEADKA